MNKVALFNVKKLRGWEIMAMKARKAERVYLISILCHHACYVVIVFARWALKLQDEERKLYTHPFQKMPRGYDGHGKAIKCDTNCVSPHQPCRAISNAIIVCSQPAASGRLSRCSLHFLFPNHKISSFNCYNYIPSIVCLVWNCIGQSIVAFKIQKKRERVIYEKNYIFLDNL